MIDSNGSAVCQSCAMPIYSDDMYGTDIHGRKSDEYCRGCYQRGEFIDPDIDIKSMVNKSVSGIMHCGLLPEAHIRESISNVIPELKRWNLSENKGHSV